jgi:DNA-binding XRE family transcriptional regulator
MNTIWESVVCPTCELRQLTSPLCRRCRDELGFAYVEIPLPPSESVFGPMGASHVRKIVAGIVRGLRTRRGYNQSKLANAIATDRTHVSRVEGARVLPSLVMLLRVVMILGVDRVYVRMRESD